MTREEDLRSAIDGSTTAVSPEEARSRAASRPGRPQGRKALVATFAVLLVAGAVAFAVSQGSGTEEITVRSDGNSAPTQGSGGGDTSDEYVGQFDAWSVPAGPSTTATGDHTTTTGVAEPVTTTTLPTTPGGVVPPGSIPPPPPIPDGHELYSWRLDPAAGDQDGRTVLEVLVANPCGGPPSGDLDATVVDLENAFVIQLHGEVPPRTGTGVRTCLSFEPSHPATITLPEPLGSAFLFDPSYFMPRYSPP